jgi:hypothetical protein
VQDILNFFLSKSLVGRHFFHYFRAISGRDVSELGGTFSIVHLPIQFSVNFQLQVSANSYKMPTNHISIYKLTSQKNSIGGVIVSMLASSVVYPRISGQTKDKIKYLLLLH